MKLIPLAKTQSLFIGTSHGEFSAEYAKTVLTSTRAFDSGLYSDLTIECGPRTWRVHRLIVYSASTFFLKAGEGEFKVPKTQTQCRPTHQLPALTKPHSQEAQTKHIKLEEMDPDVLDKVLTFIYKRDYHVDAKNAVTIHPEVYKLADYLDIQPLKSVVRKKFSEALKEDWEVVSFTKALRTIYTSTPASDRGLRDVAKAHLAAHKKSLRNHRGFMDLIEKNFADGRLVMDVLDAWTKFEEGTPAASSTTAAGGVKKPRVRAKTAKAQT